jgi:paraquat-inducible protein B
LLNEIIESNPIEKAEFTNPSAPTQPEVPTQPSIVEKINPPELITVKDTTKDLHIRGEHYDIDNNTVSKVTRTKDGKKEEMKFTLKNGKVTELYVDGKKVPESEYGKYQSEVDEIIDDLKDAKVDIREAIHDIENLDLEEIHAEIEEAMKNVHIDIKAAQEDIKRAMEDIEMVNVEEIMRNVEIELNELDKLHDMDFDFDIDFDGESYHFDMGEINIEEIREQMNEVREEMREQIDMKKIQSEMLKMQEELSKLTEEEIQFQIQENAKHFEEFNKQETIEDLQKQLEELENLELEEK